MSVKRTGQLSLADALIAGGGSGALDRWAGLMAALFGELDRQWAATGLMVRRGTLMDATLVGTTVARPRDDRPVRDPDAAFARRQGKAGSAYGDKAHVGVDEGSGLTRPVIVTPANGNEPSVADDLPRGDEVQVWGDAACHTQAREAAPKARPVKPRPARRPNQHHPLSERFRRDNRPIARRRAAVESTFATCKNRRGPTATRCIGQAKATAQVTMAAHAFNLRGWAALTA